MKYVNLNSIAMTMSPNHATELARFALGAATIGIITYFVATRFHVFPLWAVALAVFIYATIIMLSGMYVGVLRKVHDNTLFRKDGWLYSVLSRRLLLAIGWFVWGVVSAFFVMIQLNLYSIKEWMVFALTFPVYSVAFIFCRNLLAKHVQSLHVIRIALTWTRWMVPLVMVAIYAIFAWQMTPVEKAAQPVTLKESIAQKRGHIVISGGSAIVDEALQIYSAIEGGVEFVTAKLGELSNILAAFLSVFAAFIVSYNVCLLLSCLIIPISEYRRLLAPITDLSDPPPVSFLHVVLLSAVVVFLSIFVYLHGIVALETWISQSEKWKAGRKIIEETVIVKVDEIAGEYYKAGTITKIEDLRTVAWKDSVAAANDLGGKVDEAFAAMEQNVDKYLDWYYSLPAEYMRIAKTLTGSLESHIENQLMEHLNQNDPFRRVSEAMNDVVAKHQLALAKFQAGKERILAENKIEVSSKHIRIERMISDHEFSIELAPPESITTQNRLASAAAVSVATTLVAKKIVAKVVAKGIFKTAVTAASKLAAAKAAGGAAGAAAGAATGAALGSIFPVAGTIIGGFFGAIGGIFIGVGVDAALLKLDEEVNRADFKQEILESIASAKNELKSDLFAK